MCRLKILLMNSDNEFCCENMHSILAEITIILMHILSVYFFYGIGRSSAQHSGPCISKQISRSAQPEYPLCHPLKKKENHYVGYSLLFSVSPAHTMSASIPHKVFKHFNCLSLISYN